jgi:putative addiction module component (TIGR02574 family)
MSTAAIDKKINNYLSVLNDRQKRALLTIAKTFAEESEIGYSGDFKSELDRRTSELESGKIKGRTWEEVKQDARRSTKTKKSK